MHYIADHLEKEFDRLLNDRNRKRRESVDLAEESLSIIDADGTISDTDDANAASFLSRVEDDSSDRDSDSGSNSVASSPPRSPFPAPSFVEIQALTVDDVFLCKPLEDTPFGFNHLGTLYLLSRDSQDGYIYREHCSAFGVLCHTLKDEFRFTRDFQGALRAYGMICLWRDMSEDGGRPRITEWLHALVVANSSPLKTFREYPGTSFIFRDTIKTLHQLLRVHDAFAIDLQAFFDLLQRTAEEMQLLSLADERLDDWIPESVVRQFLSRFIDGLGRMMSGLGFHAGVEE